LGQAPNPPQQQPFGKGEMEGLPKKEKGLKAAAWLMQVAGKKYLHVSKEVSATESLKKGNKWESEKQMLDKFDWDEFQAHIGSGRVTYREDPHTPGVWKWSLVRKRATSSTTSATRMLWGLALKT